MFSISFQEVDSTSLFVNPFPCIGEIPLLPHYSDANSLNTIMVNLTDDVFNHYSAFFKLESKYVTDGESMVGFADNLTVQVVEKIDTPTTAPCNRLIGIGHVLFSLPKEEDFGQPMTLQGREFENVLIAE